MLYPSSTGTFFNMSKLTEYLKNTVADLSKKIKVPGLHTEPQQQPQYAITDKAGRRGVRYRRIIRHVQLGPFYRQVATKKDGEPVIEKYIVHRFLHATKGWREYRHGLPYTPEKGKK